MDKYYLSTKEEVLSVLNSNENGLSSAEAADRLVKNGKNELEQGKKKTLLQKFFAQFKDVMIIVLIAAALISASIAVFQKEYSELFEGGIILLIVIINAVIGLIQENKAESALEALKNMNKPFSKVIRNGELMQIRSEEIVIGDIIQLDAGDIVPADMRLLSSASLKIEEAALTGESVPSEKSCDDKVIDNAALGDRTNMAYSSGIIAYGRGRGIVVATAMNTEVGKIAKLLSETESDSTPLQKQLAKTAKILSIVVLAIATIIFAASLIRQNPIIEAFMTSVAIAVAAIPEGLPAVVTIVLAIGVQRMSKKNAIIRNLPAVETLGCCEIICSDKTGTLTLNQMTVKQIYTASSQSIATEDIKSEGDSEVLIRAITLCNDTAESSEGLLLGDPTETALVAFAKKCGYVYKDLTAAWRRIDEKPFDSIRKLMSTVNHSKDTTVAHIKGAPDILIKKCTRILVNGEVRN
ncbi:MAG: ATPase, partial [Clostridia bacterium]|nr:ATPase [Clostridia bacterium]